MTHTSNNNDILWYVDTISYKDNIYTFGGWIAHSNEELEKLDIENKRIQVFKCDREDVKEVYPNAFSIMGFLLNVNENDIKKPVDVYLKGDKIVQIESLYKFVTFYSGYNINHKNLIVVDNFYYNPDMVRDYAINNLKYEENEFARGKRSLERFFLNGTKERLEGILGRKIVNWESEDYSNGIFQFCTSKDPIVIHSDNQQFAGIVYLTPDAPLASGTQTYKSKITGATRFEDVEKELEVINKTFKGISKQSNFYDRTTFEVVDSVANVYNRLVMWDAKAIHAATQYFGDDIENSRFFQLFFFDVE